MPFTTEGPKVVRKRHNFLTIGKTGQRIGAILKTSEDDDTYEIRIRRAFKTGKGSPDGDAVLETYGAKVLSREILTKGERGSDLLVPVGVGLMKELAIFFSNFEPDSKESAESWCQCYKTFFIHLRRCSRIIS